MSIIQEAALVIEDFSALGQISMVAALTVLQSMNYTTAALPTAMLSTQTECFGNPQRLDTVNWMNKSIGHWQSLPDLDFNGALIGYLGQTALINPIEQLLAQKMGNRPVIVDPVMGDEGSLYPGLNQDYVQAIRKLCQQATVITPNWTELCLLTNAPQNYKMTSGHAEQLLGQLTDVNINAQVVITGVKLGQQTGCVLQSREEGFKFVGNPQVPGHFYGTGDTFAALLLGFLLQDGSLTHAVKKATKMVYTAIQATAVEEPVTNRKYGIKLGQLIKQLTTNGVES